jgi:hypothetical protein
MYNEVRCSGQGEGASIPLEQSGSILGSFFASRPARADDRCVGRRCRLDERAMKENDKRMVHHATRELSAQ